MRVITRPTVVLVGRTVFIPNPDRAIPPSVDDAASLCAYAGKGCYDSFGVKGRSCEENQIEIIKSGHGSVLEHFSVSLWVEGITRACSHEIVRHRAGFAYSQRSTRYTAEEDASIVLEPYFARIHERPSEFTAREHGMLAEHLAACKSAFAAYRSHVEDLMQSNPENLEGFALRKWARGKARNVLPNALETRMTITGNLRAWRHFVEMRSSRHAEPEIRRLAHRVFNILAQVAPVHFSDYIPEVVRGIPEFTTPYTKV